MLEPKEEIRQKLDIVDVISEYLQLKPAGSGSFKAVCPFHAEKTPSFHISRERQIWHCFGCNMGGDVFRFVMDMDGMTFPEALRHLGEKAGVVIPEFTGTKEQGVGDRLKRLHKDAADVYAKMLKEHISAYRVRAYIEARNIPDDLVTKFQLGASVDAWDTLASILTKRGYSENELVLGGLALKRKSGTGVVDRFRNRLMIPLCDAAGAVVAFTARELPGAADDGPKYMNSPETPIYHKGSMLYGLHLAKTAIRHKGEAIIVEGNLDVIASFKAGVENVVGSSGTALTEMQVRLLARYAKRLVFCLDADVAGFNALRRVYELALSLQSVGGTLDVELRCMIIPEGAGKDPDDVVTKDPNVWRSLAEKSVEIIEYFFSRKLRELESAPNDMNARTRLVDELIPEAARLHRRDSRHLYLLRIADATHVDVNVLYRMLDDTQKKSPAMVKPAAPAAQKNVPVHASQLDLAGEFLLGLAMKHDGFCGEALAAVDEAVLGAKLRGLYTALRALYATRQSPQTGVPHKNLYLRLRDWLEREGRSEDIAFLDALTLRTDELLAGLSPQAVRAEANQHIAFFQRAALSVRQQNLLSDIRAAEMAGDADRVRSLMTEYSALITRSSRAL